MTKPTEQTREEYKRKHDCTTANRSEFYYWLEQDVEIIVQQAYQEGYQQAKEKAIASVPKIDRVKPMHGTCCTCQDCGYDNDGGCKCGRNEVLGQVLANLNQI